MLRFIQWLTRQEWLLRVLHPLFGRFDPFLPEHRRDPHATWRALRETAPVYRSPAFGTWLCTRYDDVLHVLRDPNFSTDRSDVPAMKLVMRMARKDPQFSALIERNLLTLDGADHRRLRRAREPGLHAAARGEAAWPAGAGGGESARSEPRSAGRWRWWPISRIRSR